MPKITDDSRDPMKLELGKKLKQMKKDNPEKLQEFLLSLTDKEAEEILFDDEIWLRENQWIPLDSKKPVHFMSLGRGAGKLMCKDTPIITPDRGFVRLGDLEVGDQVYDERGVPCNITETHDDTPDKSYRFTFSDGAQLDCCSEHLWTTWEHRDRRKFLRLPENKNTYKMPKDWPEWNLKSRVKSEENFGPKVRTAQEIVDTFYQGGRGDLNHSIPVTQPLEMEDVEVPFDPYLMGYWIGDGTKGNANFTIAPEDQESFIARVNQAGYTVGANSSYKRVSLLSVLPLLRKTSSFEDKIIDRRYVFNSYHKRLEFLRGLMDSDGYMSPNGTHCEFCSMTEEHARVVFFLAASLGYKPTIKTGSALFDGRDYGTKYRVFWNPKPDTNPFHLERKASLVKYPKSQGFRNCHRMISSYEEIDTKPMRCLTVDSPNRLFLAGESLIPTHNTKTGAATVKRAVEKHGVKDILVIAATSRDIRSTIVPAIVESYPDSHTNKPYFSPAKNQIIWPNGALVDCLTSEAGEDSPRGNNTALCWLDEAGFYGNNEGIIDQALLTMRLEPSIMLITTTPKATPKMIEFYERGANPDDTMIQMYTGSTYENEMFLSDVFMDTVVRKYEGTRMGDTELEGKLILTNDAALWQYHTIVENTIKLKDVPKLQHVCIGVDPAVLHKGSRTKKSRTPDDTGITVSGMDQDGYIYVLEGVSASFTVEGWVLKVAQYFDKYSQMCKTQIVMEINQHGEDMINLAFDSVGRSDLKKYMLNKYATQSKLERAMPYSLMAEKGEIKYVDSDYMHQLGTELTTYDGTGSSPNCFDSAVWSWRGLVPARKQYTTSKEFMI